MPVETNKSFYFCRLKEFHVVITLNIMYEINIFNYFLNKYVIGIRYDHVHLRLLLYA
jgi:hypothetical protein